MVPGGLEVRSNTTRLIPRTSFTRRAAIAVRSANGNSVTSAVIASTDDTVGKLKVVSLLESLPGWGKVKARKVMEEIGIADNRRVQGLGSQQREALLKARG